MRKLGLMLDALEVESFVTTSAAGRLAGTVAAHQEGDAGTEALKGANQVAYEAEDHAGEKAGNAAEAARCEATDSCRYDID